MKRIEDVFQEMPGHEPASGLRSRILTCIEQEQTLLLSRRRRMSIVGLVVSAFVFFVGIFQYGGPLLQSDFWRLSSLLFSDLGVVATSFQDFTFSLLETLPAVPLFALLAPLSLFLWSAGFLLSLSEKHETKHFHHGVLAH